MTASGYKFLTLNQVSFKSLTIENNSDPQPIREAVTNTVKKQQPHLKVENIKFPDLKTVGHKTVTATVSQPSLTEANKHISYDYQIPLEVTEGTLSFTQAPAALKRSNTRLRMIRKQGYCSKYLLMTLTLRPVRTILVCSGP